MSKVIFNDWVKLDVSKPVAEPEAAQISAPARPQSETVQIAAPTQVEWMKPGMMLKQNLEKEEDVLLLTENYFGSDGIEVVVLLKSPNKDLSYRIFGMERDIRKELSGIDLDLHIMTNDSKPNVQALKNSGRVYLNRIV